MSASDFCIVLYRLSGLENGCKRVGNHTRINSGCYFSSLLLPHGSLNKVASHLINLYADEMSTNLGMLLITSKNNFLWLKVRCVGLSGI